ncbi:MAG: hypothetical protein HOO97_05220 [Sideroxydans sp.]|nr:hypothetical protein [Sideroxydans sp.]NOT98477.1 hypothetical protein [Sideroxydans sp.]
MQKKIFAVLLIILTSGAWFYLDMLNKQAIKESEQARIELEQLRNQVKARAEAALNLGVQLAADLSACKAAAETTKTEFITKNQVPVKRKPGEFTLAPALMEEANKTFDAANTACQSTYDARIKSGS